jgi:hypothetical protein
MVYEKAKKAFEYVQSQKAKKDDSVKGFWNKIKDKFDMSTLESKGSGWLSWLKGMKLDESKKSRKVIKLSETDLKRIVERTMRSSMLGFGKHEMREDSEGEETFNYGEDEGADDKEMESLEAEESMAPADRISEIEKHLDALKKDMDFDEDREDRDEEGDDFE